MTSSRKSAGLALAVPLAFSILCACALFAGTSPACAQPDDHRTPTAPDSPLTAQAASSSEEPSAKPSRAVKAASTPGKPSKAQLKAFKKASASFSLDLFERCVAAKGANANVTIAPMSVMNALAVTANGAKGETRAQMRKVLGASMSIASLNKSMSWYNGKLTNSPKARVNVANSIWYHNDGSLKMKKKFISLAKTFHNAEIKPASFSDPATATDINAWVAEHTNGMIKKVVDDLDEQDRIAIVNALSLDARWRVPYDPSNVAPATFTNAKGENRTVDMMYGTERSYIEGRNVTGFVKPYAKGYSYVALLPNENTSLRQLVASLDGATFRKLVNGARTATVHTGLPKYSLSYSNENMTRQLADMGITRAFSNDADFSKMGTDAQGGLSIGSVVHKTRIDLDEEGTKAAAVTAVVMKAGSAYDPNAKTVILNRPFAYAIVDNAAKLPVFIGTVNDIGA